MPGFTKRLTVFSVAALMAGGCGGDSTGPAGGLKLTVSPATTTLYTSAPGNSVKIAPTATNRDGANVTSTGSGTFISDNTAVASVAADGTITAVAAGTAKVTTTFTAGGLVGTATTTITVIAAPQSASVNAPQFAYQPATVHVGSGGSVRWSFGEIQHTVHFSVAGAPANVEAMAESSESRSFPTSGSYPYTCAIHSGMAGTVIVH